MDEDEECRIIQRFQQLLQHRNFWCSLPAVIRCHDDECNAHLALLFGRASHLADLCPSASAAPSHHMAPVCLEENACGELSTWCGQTTGLEIEYLLAKAYNSSRGAIQWSSDALAGAGRYG